MSKLTLDDLTVEPDTGERYVLPFNDQKQKAVLGYLIKDLNFYLLARNIIKPEWFIDAHCQIVWQAKLDFFVEYHRQPSIDELKNSETLKRRDQAMRNKCVATINDCLRETDNFGLDVLENEIDKWLHARIFYEGVTNAKKVWNNEHFQKAYVIAEDTVKRIKATSFKREREESLEDITKDIQEEIQDLEGALTFGISVVDKLLVSDPEAKGGLLPGDTTILLAPTNVGKTTSMITTAVANILNQKYVCIFTHEGRPQDIKKKIRCCLLDVDSQELRVMTTTPEGRARLAAAAGLMKEYLVFVPYNKAGLTVEEVEPLVRRKQDDVAARNEGRGIELFVCDYPAKLTTVKAAGGHMSKRNIDEIVYGYYVQYALEYKWHTLLAIQTNREGARVNKGQREGERRLLTMEDVHESYGPMQEATNVITMNRDPRAKALGRLTYHIDKSRSSETGWAVVCKTKYEHAITHSDNLGAIYYRGTDTRAGVVDTFLNEKSNWGKMMPDMFDAGVEDE